VSRVPVVENNELIGEVGEHWNLLLSVVVHDLVSKDSGVLLASVHAELLVNEALHGRSNGLGLDTSVVWGESSKELNVVAVNGMVGVVQDGVVVIGAAASLALGLVVQVVRVAEGAVVNGVLKTLDGLSTKEVVD
jgi:hypothetical protein